MRETEWIPLVNVSGDAIPSYGVVIATGMDEDGNLEVDTPSADNETGAIILDAGAMQEDGYGQGSLANRTIVAYDERDGTPAAGEEWGVKSGEYRLREGYYGFRILGGASGGLVNAVRVAAAGGVSSWKEPVRVATTSAGTLSSSFENGDTVDGVTLVTGDRILVKNQASGSENGIRVVVASGTPARATDCDAASEFYGATVHVIEGTVNADTVWQCVTNPTITVDTTATVWELTSQPASGETLYSANTTIGTSWTDTTWDLAIPRAGTYDVCVEGFVQTTANVDGSGGTSVTMRWYNETTAAAITDSQAPMLHVAEGTTNKAHFFSKKRITLTAAATLRVEVHRANSGVSNSQLLGAVADGFGTNTVGRVSYVRVAP